MLRYLLLALATTPLWMLGDDVNAAPPRGKNDKKAGAGESVKFPPVLPDGKSVISDSSPEFLQAPATLQDGVQIAKTPPKVDFLYFPGQDYPGKPWSSWGDSLAVNGKYYASIGDHLAPAGNAFVYEYDPATMTFRQLLNLRELLKMPDGHYSPGKIHSRLDLGDDGWLYCSTHRGSTKVTSDAFHYAGDWIVRCHPVTAKSEIVAQGPVPKHCIPTSVLDPQRLIFYGGTAEGEDAVAKGVQFFAYDIRAKKNLFTGPNGPYRYLIFAPSTGRVYFNAGPADTGPLMRFDPDHAAMPIKIDGEIGLRAATQETPRGFVYTVSSGQARDDAKIWSFNTKTEKIEQLGNVAVGSQAYVASLDADPSGRYLYYVPGAHGGSDTDNAAVVQFDLQTRQKKVLAFLHPYFKNKIGCTLKGTYSLAVDPRGDKLYITWNASRAAKVWDCCVLTVIHIPEQERPL